MQTITQAQWKVLQVAEDKFSLLAPCSAEKQVFIVFWFGNLETVLIMQEQNNACKCQFNINTVTYHYI